MTRCTEAEPEAESTIRFHTHDTTVWFRLAYCTSLPWWRVIPRRWLTRRCPLWRQL